MKKIEPNKRVIDESLMDAYYKALRDYHLALQKYGYAVDDYEDTAFHQIQVTKDNLNNIIRLIKLNQNIPVHVCATRQSSL